MSRQHPKVLVTNDDGIDSFFLKKLVEALIPFFEVFVVAPLTEQSWIGRAISRDKTIHLAKYEGFACKAWALDGTPSDCVNVALSHILPELPDIVVSGINLDYNVSIPMIFSSGTVAGAIEGAAWGLRAVAFSHRVPAEQYLELRAKHCKVSGELLTSIENAAAHAARFAIKELHKPHKRLVFNNVNYPIGTKADCAERQTHPCRVFHGSLYVKETDTSFRFRYPDEIEIEAEEGTDLDCLLKGEISVTEVDLNVVGQQHRLLARSQEIPLGSH